MRDLTLLGFQKDVESCNISLDIDGEKVVLPDDYLEFQAYKPPQDLNLKFMFTESTTGNDCEGQVVEFVYYDDVRISGSVVTVPGDPPRKLLPVSVDAGGNYTYMDLTSASKQIVDVNYGAGAISFVAATFGEFLDKLVVEEE